VFALSPDGTENIWNYTGVNMSWIDSIAIDSEENIIIGGHNNTKIGVITYSNAIIVKLDKDGTNIWNHTFAIEADTGHNKIGELAVDSYDDIIATVSGGNKWKILKLNSTGHQTWNTTYKYKENAYGVDVDSEDYIYILGNNKVIDISGTWYTEKLSMNSIHLGDVKDGDNYEGWWVVNATGGLDSSWYIDVQAASNNSDVPTDTSNSSQINITGIAADDTCTYGGSGDWTITDTCIKIDEVIDLDSDLLCENGCLLYLVNSCLNFTSTSQFLYVYSGGRLELNESSDIDCVT